MDIGKIVYFLRSIGVGGIIRTLGNSITRGHIQRKYSRETTQQQKIYPGLIQHFSPINNGFLIQFSHADVEIIFLSENMVRISWSPGKPPYPYTLNKFDWAPKTIEQISNGLSPVKFSY
jgi:alpha-glucosidase